MTPSRVELTRLDIDHGFERELRATPEFDAFLAKTTTKTAAAVRAAAPDVSGYYRRRVRARGTRIVASDPFWHLVEFGSVNNRAFAPLRSGVIAAGLRFDPSRI